MTEFEWQKKTSRNEAASLLRVIADGLAGDGKVELERDGWQLTLPVGRQIALEVEVEVEEGETELEIQLKWSTSSRRRPNASSRAQRSRRLRRQSHRRRLTPARCVATGRRCGDTYVLAQPARARESL